MSAPARQQQQNGRIALPNQPGQPARVGQGTAIEQSRAAAEVYARVLVAQQAPRDEQAAMKRMKDACGMKALADRAFFRFNRGGQVSGASVHLARELARSWGNIDYGVFELSRDDVTGQSEMQAFAWDLETNARSSSIFIVPHMRDKKSGPERLVDMRDIYENNANAGARRVREAIFGVLPLWYTEQAKDLCTATLENGGGKPLQQRISGAIDYFGGYKVSEAQLVTKIGKPRSEWTVMDIATLEVIGQSLRRGEITVDDEFPREEQTVTGTEVRARAGRTQQRGPATSETSSSETTPTPSEPSEYAAGVEGEDPWGQTTLDGDS